MKEPNFKKFADEVINLCYEGDICGADIQDFAIECGLLKEEIMKESCATDETRCLCQEYDAEFPVLCNRKNYKIELQSLDG